MYPWEEKPPRKNKGRHCGVLQCNAYDSDGVSMHAIPKAILNSKKLRKEWMIALKMGKNFPNHFRICSKHFDKNQLLVPRQNEDKLQKVFLAKGAFPNRNLPQSGLTSRSTPSCKMARGIRLETRISAIKTQK